MADLLASVELPNLECLNALPDHPLANALKQGYREDDGLYLESDTDEQLLIHIPFQSAVSLSGLVLKSVKSEDQAPKRVKLYVNKPTLGFSGAPPRARLAPPAAAAARLVHRRRCCRSPGPPPRRCGC